MDSKWTSEVLNHPEIRQEWDAINYLFKQFQESNSRISGTHINFFKEKFMNSFISNVELFIQNNKLDLNNHEHKQKLIDFVLTSIKLLKTTIALCK